jgi:peptidoglycan/xylan/chitin deacetylase (PgdA/CDA1 family)
VVRVLPLTLVLSVVPAATLSDLPPPVEVLVDGEAFHVPPRTTLARAQAILGLRPQRGDLVDVEGVVLEADRYPGHVRVNRGRADPDRVLQAGDELRVVDGRDRSEPVTVETRDIPGGRVQNPQTHLGTTPGQQVITTGEMSGKLVGSIFRPSGDARIPSSVALTFDDGPSPTFTPQILRILRRREVKATFFMVGTMIERHPELARQVMRAGMSIGNHTMRHPQDRAFAELGRNRMRAEIRDAQALLERVGAEPVAFRPPGGSFDPAVLRQAEAAGLRTVLWSIDTRDWQDATAREIYRRVVRTVEPGSIILLHDGGGDQRATVRALPRIIRALRDMGLEFETL